MLRTQNSSAVGMDDPGEEPDEGEENPQSPNTNNSGSNNLTSRNSPPLPPSYPCDEMCAHCGKKVSDSVLNGNEQPDPMEPQVNCSCECHLQIQAQSAKLMTPPAHIPPGGPNCLPGCGNFGLPCYNCSLHYYPQPPDQFVPPVSERFPTHIYTVELMSPDVPDNRQTQEDGCQHQQIILQSEDSPETRRKRRTCISLLVFIITINVAIGIFRMLSS